MTYIVDNDADAISVNNAPSVSSVTGKMKRKNTDAEEEDDIEEEDAEGGDGRRGGWGTGRAKDG